MKAIKVLKILNKYYTGNFAIEINEAIAELEVLENRKCDGCKYKSKNECSANFLIVCKRHPRLPDHYEESK